MKARRRRTTLLVCTAVAVTAVVVFVGVRVRLRDYLNPRQADLNRRLIEVLDDAPGDGVELDALEALLVAGASPNARGGDARTPFQPSTLRQAVVEGFARLTDTAPHDSPALFHALSGAELDNGHDRPAAVALLLKYGADPAAPGPNYGHPLVEAAFGGHTEIVRHLIAYAADVNWPDGTGHTPLTASAVNGSIPCMKLLLDAGADPNLRNPDGDTALDVALRSQSSGADGGARFLTRYGPKLNSAKHASPPADLRP